jgi:hypothetical protein
MKTLYLAWQDAFSQYWYPIGRLTWENGKYRFVYIQGSKDAEKSGFHGLPAFPDLSEVYESDELFPLFANRLMPRSRPDYRNFIQWLSLPEHEDDPFALLVRSGGQRATGDTLAIYPCPVKDSGGNYHQHFFVHGLRHLGEEVVTRVSRLEEGELLKIMVDAQNNHDSRALMLRTSDTEGTLLVGWFPRYLTKEVQRFLEDPSSVKITVERVNPAPAPVQFRLLCNLTVSWPDGFSPFQSGEYLPRVSAHDMAYQ